MKLNESRIRVGADRLQRARAVGEDRRGGNVTVRATIKRDNNELGTSLDMDSTAQVLGR